MKMNKFEVPWWVSLILLVIILIIGFFINQVANLLDIKSWAIASGLVIIITILSAIIGASVSKYSARNELDKSEKRLINKTEALESRIFELQNNLLTYAQISDSFFAISNTLTTSINDFKQITQSTLRKSLITYDELTQLEANVNENDEIWVLTSQLQFEDEELKDIIVRNIKKGVIYKYLLPGEDEDLQKKMIDLINYWKIASELDDEKIRRQIQCFLVPRHLSYMTVVIFGPNIQKNPIVIVKFPIDSAFEKHKYPFIYKVDSKPKEGVQRFINTFHELMDDQAYCPHAKKMKWN